MWVVSCSLSDNSKATFKKVADIDAHYRFEELTQREILKRNLTVKAILIIDGYIHGLLLMPNN